jgi:hydrogen peroxide-dependent heme synthase
MEPIAHPPETIEGWYALHQIFAVPPSARAASDSSACAAAALRELACPPEGGWSALFQIVGSKADVMLLHFRPTLDDISAAQQRVAREPLFQQLARVYSFLSVTELGLYHVTAELARATTARGGEVGDAEYRSALAERVRAEREGAHTQRRLYPPLPADMPYVCFYPMSKRRQPGQNWYELSLDERSRLMYGHGLTGRRYAGRVLQVITGAIGFESWEWGVTLFARDPLDFKKLVTDMRFDEVSAKYAEFGEFFVGRRVEGSEWVEGLG